MDDFSNEKAKYLLNQISLGGDKADRAARELYRIYFDCVYIFTRSRTYDDFAADEVRQEVFMAVFTNPDGYKGESSFKTYLGGIIKNKAADWNRKHKDEKDRIDNDSEVVDAEPDPNGDILKNLIMKKDAEALRYCMDQLPPKERERLLLLFYEYRTYAEVAKILSIAIGSLKSGVHGTAFARLKRCLCRWINGGRDA